MNRVKCVIEDDFEDYETAILMHKKNESMGVKMTKFSKTIYIEQADAQQMEQYEEITMMDWGNMIVQGIAKCKNELIIECVTLKLNLAGDVKKTKKKLTWLTKESTPLILCDFDYLITKKKLEEDDKIEDFCTSETEFKTLVLADTNISLVKKGDYVQFERKGYFICDDAEKGVFYAIPDGSVAMVGLKALTHQPIQPIQPIQSIQNVKRESKVEKRMTQSKMYLVDSCIKEFEIIDQTKISSMYTCAPREMLKM